MADEREMKMLLIKPDLHQRLKVLAAETGETMQALTEEAIRRLLMSEAQKETGDAT